ncbi:endonuclease III domain-containing protein [Leptolyngbya sp. AN02str]|uniref:endonuclease III domain-containing protein n=1 Tax=Leptolyngbya sp. AN02str TaxID=3423363 RepID=UPI003D31688F
MASTPFHQPSFLEPQTSQSSTPSSEPLQQKALLIHDRLCAVYGCPIAYFHNLDPLSELVSSLLSHRTKNRDSGRAFRQLRDRFPTWEQVRDGDVGEIEAAIAPCTYPEVKAPRLKQILHAIQQEQGQLTLDFLANLTVPEARTWLEKLPGVGPKTSAAVLCFSNLRRPALPVDSHHHRVAQRLELIPASMAVGPSHGVLAAQLPAHWSAQQVYDNHEVLMLHGQRVCHYRNPNCKACAVLDVCPFGQQRMATSSVQNDPSR